MIVFLFDICILLIIINIKIKCLKMKIYRQGALLSIICSFVGLILIGCAEEKQGVETGIHKIVIQQSGDTDSFEVSVSIGGADKGGPAKLYNDKGEYIGDSYSAQIRTATMSCCTNGNAFFMTCAGSVSSISEAGKRLHITVIGYIDDKEVNRLEKEYITDGNTLIETFSVSTKEI
jgi:hypothetical protein